MCCRCTTSCVGPQLLLPHGGRRSKCKRLQEFLTHAIGDVADLRHDGGHISRIYFLRFGSGVRPNRLAAMEVYHLGREFNLDSYTTLIVHLLQFLQSPAENVIHISASIINFHCGEAAACPQMLDDCIFYRLPGVDYPAMVLIIAAVRRLCVMSDRA